MAEDSPVAEAATIADPTVGVHDESENTTAGAAFAGESTDVTDNASQPGLVSTRTRSSKVANLRAAFEQSANPGPITPRSVSVVSTGRNGTADAEVARLKEALGNVEDALAKEKELSASEREALAEEKQAREANEQHIKDLQDRQDAAQMQIGELQRVRDSDQAQIESLQAARLTDEGGIAELQKQLEAERHRVEQLQMQVTELEKELKQQLDVVPEGVEEVQPDHTDADQLAEDLHLAKGQVQAYEQDVLTLRTQLNDMKRSIATNTRIESHEVTDSAFQAELGTICYLMQDWTVSTYRKAKIERSPEEMLIALDTVNAGLQKSLRPLFERWDGSSKLVVLQSMALAIILPIFQDPLPFGLPPSSTFSRAIKEASAELGELLESSAFNRWRATTFDVICHSEGISPFVQSAASNITESVLEVLRQVCGLETAATQSDALRNIIRRVIALSHSLRVQRATYEVELPSPGSIFDTAAMEGVSGDHEDLAERKIECAVFPIIYKLTPSGERAVLFKARVSWKESWD